MPSQPQRPFRAFKVRDENLPPTSLATKTIHQRNKSSPALYTLAQAGATKLATKRTAFADVSNTARPLQVIKDDSAINSKAGLDILKDSKYQDYVKPAALLRPAQRPMSVTGIKGFLNNLTSLNSSNIPKPLATESRNDVLPQTLIPSKAINKPASTVLNENEPRLGDVVDNGLPESHNTVSSIQPSHISLQNVGSKVDEHVGIPLQAISKTVFEPRLDANAYQFGKAVSDYQDVRSDGTHLYTVEPLPAIYPERRSHFDASEIYVDAASHILSEVEPARVNESKTFPRLTEKEVDVPHLLPVSELEEYWEEAGYDDEYDDAGYTTARSIKSKGDYTTGSNTVVLAPRITANVERELAAAKQMVLQARAADESEDDESWDTSMVAEYGEEIFSYMRTLEVCLTVYLGFVLVSCTET